MPQAKAIACDPCGLRGGGGKVISEEGHAGKVYELAGDNAWTLSELAAELSKQKLEMRPAAPDTGIIFRRVDLTPPVELPARPQA